MRNGRIVNALNEVNEVIADLQAESHAKDILVKDCAMLLRRWTSQFKDTQLAIQTKDFLKRKNLQGSPLRKKK